MSDPTATGDALRSAGLRVTPQRIAVLDALPTGEHRDVDAVAAAVRGRIGTVSTQAVYNALGALVAAGLVRRIEPAGCRATYETRVGDNHHHVVCRQCGATADVDCAVGGAPCLAPVAAHGFVVDEAEVTYWGVCPDCARQRGTGSEDGMHDDETDSGEVAA